MNLPQTFPLSGMTCGTCAVKVAARLREHPAISSAEVTIDPPQAHITTPSPFSNESLNEWLRPLGKYRVGDSSSPPDTVPAAAKTPQTYRPLIILFAYLLLVIGAATVAAGSFQLPAVMRLFMGGFFIAFSFFKMLDLRGFAEAYRGYDLIAQIHPGYGKAYPFVELALGLAYLSNWQPVLVNAATAAVMAISLVGVVRAVLSKTTIRCACLGTVFNLPMSTVTIVEDALMFIMAILALLLPH